MEVEELRLLLRIVDLNIEKIEENGGATVSNYIRGVRDGFRMVSSHLEQHVINLEASHEQNAQRSKDQAAEESRRLQDAEAGDAQVHQREEGSQPIGMPRGYSGGFLI